MDDCRYLRTTIGEHIMLYYSLSGNVAQPKCFIAITDLIDVPGYRKITIIVVDWKTST